MATYYDTLLGGQYDRDRMLAMAERLRQREAVATLATLTGDPVLGQFGASQLGRLQEQTANLATARRQSQQPIVYGQGYYGLPGQEPQRLPGLDEVEEREYQRRLNIARAGRSSGSGGLAQTLASILGVGTHRQWAQKQGFAGEGRAILEEWNQAAAGLHPKSPGERAQVLAPYRDLPAIAAENLGMQWLSGRTQEAMKTDLEQDIRQAGENWIAELRHSRLGAAVTAMENTYGEKWNPFAKGINDATARRRMQRLIDQVQLTADALLAGQDIPTQAMPRTADDEEEVKAGAGGTWCENLVRPDGLSDEEWNQYLDLEGCR